MEQTLESLKNYKGQFCPYVPAKLCQETPCSGCALYPKNKEAKYGMPVSRR